MTGAATTTARRRSGTAHVLPMPAGVGFALGGGTVVVSAIVGAIADQADDAARLLVQLVIGLTGIGIGIGLMRLQRARGHVTAAMAMAMIVAGWLGLTVVAFLGMLASGQMESVGDAAFEAVSATTTSGFTTILAPEELPHYLQLQRVLFQWAAGLGVLAVAMGVLPVAVAGAELTTVRPLRGKQDLVTSARSGLGKILGLYLLLTASLLGGYLLFGMPVFDSISYALSTASTGGMANHANSIGAFDSAGIELVATAGMMAAGGNLAIVWWAFNGAWGSVWRSTELRLYVSLLGLGVLGVWIGSGSLGLLDSAFAVASMSSTTGLRSADWAATGSFPTMVLLAAAGIGAMSGSVGSGFRLARTARVALEVRRGLRRLLKPSRIGVIRIDGRAVDEDSLARTYGYLWMHLFTLAAIAIFINTTRLDVIGTLTISLSMVSNVGVYVQDGSVQSVVDLGGWSELIGGIAMVLGRLSIYPVLITVAGVWRLVSRLDRPRRIR